MKEPTQASDVSLSGKNTINLATVKGSIKPWENSDEQLRNNFNPSVTFVFNPESDIKQ